LAGKTVGENNAGFLQAIGTAADADKTVIEAENTDRKAVYAAIAAKNGTDAAVAAAARRGHRGEGQGRNHAPVQRRQVDGEEVS